MLKAVKTRKLKAGLGKFVIVASSYNARYVNGMLRAAKQELTRAEVEGLRVIRVPGAFEIPAVAAKLAARTDESYAAIICLGVILRGETTHAQNIGEAVSNSLAQIQVQHQVPVIHEVLLLETEEQARVRCLGRKHNRGAEAAQTALEMAKVMREI